MDASVRVRLPARVAAEANLLRVILAAYLKGIALLQPGIRQLLLVAVADFLAEHAVFVADAAAVGRIAERGQRIQKAGGQAAEAAIAECPVSFLILNLIEIDSQLL